MRDMHKKGRDGTLRGEDSPLASISNDVALQIKKMIQDGKTTGEISRALSVRFQTVWSIRRGVTFAWMKL